MKRAFHSFFFSIVFCFSLFSSGVVHAQNIEEKYMPLLNLVYDKVDQLLLVNQDTVFAFQDKVEQVLSSLSPSHKLYVVLLDIHEYLGVAINRIKERKEYEYEGDFDDLELDVQYTNYTYNYGEVGMEPPHVMFSVVNEGKKRVYQKTRLECGKKGFKDLFVPSSSRRYFPDEEYQKRSSYPSSHATFDGEKGEIVRFGGYHLDYFEPDLMDRVGVHEFECRLYDKRGVLPMKHFYFDFEVKEVSGIVRDMDVIIGSMQQNSDISLGETNVSSSVTIKNVGDVHYKGRLLIQCLIDLDEQPFLKTYSSMDVDIEPGEEATDRVSIDFESELSEVSGMKNLECQLVDTNAGEDRSNNTYDYSLRVG